MYIRGYLISFYFQNKMNYFNVEDIRVEKNQEGVDTYLFDPYNPLNKEIPVEEIQKILKSYGVDVPIYNYQLYKRAFIHRSYTRLPDEIR